MLVIKPGWAECKASALLAIPLLLSQQSIILEVVFLSHNSSLQYYNLILLRES